MTVIGYIRVSSNKQTLEHQRFEIEEYARKHKYTAFFDKRDNDLSVYDKKVSEDRHVFKRF